MHVSVCGSIDLDSTELVPLFRDFIQRYTSSLESSLSIGRTILPKPATPTPSNPNPTQKLPPGKVTIPPLSMDPAHRTPNYTSPLANINPTSDHQLCALTMPSRSADVSQLTRPLPELLAMQANAQTSKTPPEILAMQAFSFPAHTQPELLAMQTHASSVGYNTLPTTLGNVKVGDLLSKVGSTTSNPLITSRVTVQERSKPPPQLECFEVLSTSGYTRRPPAIPNSASVQKPRAQISYKCHSPQLP